MTYHKMTKKDFDEKIEKVVNIKDLKIDDLQALKRMFNSELEISLRFPSDEPHLTPRNWVCFNNCIRCLGYNDLIQAFWEMTDICSYKRSTDYITTNELALVVIAIDNILVYMRKEK